jgi:energy-converting hydrogenase B subunit D
VTVVVAVSLAMVAIGAPAVVLVDDPLRQAIVISIYGLFLASAFFALQAPDVALSMLVVGTVLLPAMVLLALSRIRGVPLGGLDADAEDDGGE